MNVTWLIDWMNVTWLIDRFSMIKMMVLMGRKWSGHHSWIKGWVMGLMEWISCGSVQEIFVLFPKFTPLCSIMASLQFSFWYSALKLVKDTSLTNWSNFLQMSGEFLNVFPGGILLTRIEYVFQNSDLFKLLNPSCWPWIWRVTLFSTCITISSVLLNTCLNLIRMFTYNNATTRLKLMQIVSHVYKDRMFISMFTCKNATTRI